MKEKVPVFAWVIRPNPFVHWWFKILMMGVCLGILIVWGIDGLNIYNLQSNFVVLKLNDSSGVISTSKDFNFDNISFSEPSLDQQIGESNLTHQSLAQTHEIIELNLATDVSAYLRKDQEFKSPISKVLPWVSAKFESNYSSNLLGRWLAPGGEPCKDSTTVDISVPNVDGNRNIELSASDIHEFVFQAVDENGNPRCLGGDYFETDISGEKWKSRPPVKDMGNGTYTFSLQVHPDFVGNYNLTIILLFRHYQGLKLSPARFAYDKVLRVVPVKFYKSRTELPEIRQCEKFDYDKDVWSGRWTRHAKNDSCPISNDGRYRCQEADFPCVQPWCNGPLGLIESNGWIYSAHCSFNLFSSEEAWNCLNNRWIFWWGDSNHCDTIRNILHFIMDSKHIPVVERRADLNITNPNNPSQTVRFTSIFNGHYNDTKNYQGLNSLIDREYQDLLKGYFSRNVVPDTIVMNSGLHDGVFWSNLRKFVNGADFAANFWYKVIEGVRKRGLVPPEVIYRTTVATGGYARSLAFNPQKMEHFNGVVLDKLREYGILSKVIDDFDMTYPWHFDNRCNDGVHYGRAPLKMKWRDGEIGHQYFVDLMLGHVLINALCTR